MSKKFHLGSNTGKAPRNIAELDKLGMARLTRVFINPFDSEAVIGWYQIILTSDSQAGETDVEALKIALKKIDEERKKVG